MVDWTAPSQANVDAYFKDLNNWGRWGDDDQLGTANTITLEKQAAAQALVRSGRAVSLVHEIAAQPALTYYVTYPMKRESADIVVDRFGLVYHGYSVTHIDALCHVGFNGELYNGRPFKESFSRDGAKWCPIDPLFGGLTTRGVLLDVASARPEGYVTVGKPVTPPDLDAAAARAGVAVEPGDVVVVRSGQAPFEKANPDWVPRVSPHPGLHMSCIEWFRDKDIAAIAWDNDGRAPDWL